MKRFGMLRTALAGCLAVTLAVMPLSAYAREEKETKPAVSDTAQTTGENAADNRESLRDALAGKQSGDGSLALDMARLCALLGYEEDAGLQVSSAPWIGDYETCAVEDGIAVVPGGSRYLMVESPAGLGKRNVIWAGVIGDADAPQAGLRLEKQTAAKDQKGVALDLSELFANYDSERVVVQAAGEGKT